MWLHTITSCEYFAQHYNNICHFPLGYLLCSIGETQRLCRKSIQNIPHYSWFFWSNNQKLPSRIHWWDETWKYDCQSKFYQLLNFSDEQDVSNKQINIFNFQNDALNENVWMMAICIELRIPLFLVGKPGSSKSLAKTIVTDVMQGPNSYSDLFKKLKEIHMVSFQ